MIWQVDFHLPIQSMYFTSEAGELDPLSMVKCTCHHYIFFSDEQKITGFLGYFFLYINKTEILLKKNEKQKYNTVGAVPKSNRKKMKVT